MDEIHKIVSFLSGQVSLQPVTLKEEDTDTELTLIDEYVGEQLLMDEQKSCELKPNPNNSPYVFQPINDSGRQFKSFPPQAPSDHVILKNERYSVMNHRYNLRPRKWLEQRYLPNFDHVQPSLPYTQSPSNNTARKKASSGSKFNKKDEKMVKIKPDNALSKSKGHRLFQRHSPQSEQVSESKDIYKISSKTEDVDLKRLTFLPHKEKLWLETASDLEELSARKNFDFENMFVFPPGNVNIKQEEKGDDIVIRLRRAKCGNLTTWHFCKNEEVVTKPKTRRSKAPKKSKKRKLPRGKTHFCRETRQSVLRKIRQIAPTQRYSRKPKKSQGLVESHTRTDNRFVEKRSKIGKDCILKWLFMGPYRFACSGCVYKTNIRNQMMIHLRRHKGEKPFKCAHCSYSSVEKSHLTRHMKIHTGERPHKCAFCNYSCIQKVSLDHHLRRCH